MSQEITKDILDKLISTESKPIFLDFYASWCGPCNNFSPIFDLLANLYSDKAIFGKVNVDNCRDLAIKYRVASIPTILCIKNNTVAWTHIGTLDESEFRKKIDSLL